MCAVVVVVVVVALVVVVVVVVVDGVVVAAIGRSDNRPTLSEVNVCLRFRAKLNNASFAVTNTQCYNKLNVSFTHDQHTMLLHCN